MKTKFSTLKTWRLNHKYSLWKVAVAVGVTVPTIARWENGCAGVRIDNLLKLSEVTLIPLSVLSEEITGQKKTKKHKGE